MPKMTMPPLGALTEREETFFLNMNDDDEDTVVKLLRKLRAYRARAITKVITPIRDALSEKEMKHANRMKDAVREEAGEVAALTYLRLFFPTVDEEFYGEVRELFEGAAPEVARRAMYRTTAWKTEVQKTQALVKYPFGTKKKPVLPAEA